jgi:hypothetical protein
MSTGRRGLVGMGDVTGAALVGMTTEEYSAAMEKFNDESAHSHRKMEVKLDKEMTTALTKLNRSHGHGTRSATQNNGNGDEKHKDQNADDNLKKLSKESEEDLTDQILQNKMTKLLMQKPQK